MADYSIEVHNGAVAVDSDVHLSGLDDVRTSTTIAGETTLHSDSSLTANTDARLSVEPVELASTATVGVDLQPVAVDTCLRIELAPPPPTVVRTPWTSRLGFTWLGVEVLAVSVSGEVRTHVEPAPRTPQTLGTVERHGHEAAPPLTTGVTVRLGP